jgi:hypothetical protein
LVEFNSQKLIKKAKIEKKSHAIRQDHGILSFFLYFHSAIQKLNLISKTARDRFYRKPRKPKQSVGFWYKIQFSKFEKKETENYQVFPV